MSNLTALQQLRARVEAMDCYTAHGGRDSGLAFADISTEHVKAFRDRILDMIDESGVDSQPPVLASNPAGVHHEFRDGPIHANANGQCVIIEANHPESGDDAEVCLDMAEARAFHTWLGRVLGVHETNGNASKLESALRGLYWDQVEYLALNKLGGMNNHWMRAAREALGMDPSDTRVLPDMPELRHDSPKTQFADVFSELDKGYPVNTQDAMNALWWKVRNQQREIARLHQKSVAEPELEPIYVAGPGTPIIGHRAKPSAPAATSLATPVPDSSPGTAAGADLGGKP